MTLKKYFNNRNVVEAAELFSAGFCNLNCSYCYIPKKKFLKEIHKNIMNKIETGQYLQELYELFGDDLNHISHWGTEPTLTIRNFKKFYNDAINKFPKLKNIMLSSNFMTTPENLINFICLDLPKTRPLEIKIQVSIDGPPWITDKNRGPGTTDIIMKHVFEVTKQLSLNNNLHKIQMHVKPTIGQEDIKILSDIQQLIKYYKFFDEFLTDWIAHDINKNIIIQREVDPTIVLPFEYTTEDGINFSKLLENQIILKQNKYKSISQPESNYYHRFINKTQVYKELFTKQKMFTCSSGDSMIGIGENTREIHSCHRTFFTNHPDYEQAAIEHKLDDLTIKGIELNRNKLLIESNTSKYDNKLNTIKMLYSSRCYNDFTKHKYSTGVAMALELANCGQISKEFTNETLAFLLTLLIQTTDCPMDNIVTSGNSLIPSLPMYRLFGNGVAQNIFSRIIKRRI